MGSESGSGGEPRAKVKGGFGVCELSVPLAALLGEERMGRTEVVKALWAHIKGKNLQNPKDRRKIILDEGLGTVFKHPLTMFNMNKQLSRHLHYRDSMQSKADSQPAPKPKKPPAPKKCRLSRAKRHATIPSCCCSCCCESSSLPSVWS